MKATWIGLVLLLVAASARAADVQDHGFGTIEPYTKHKDISAGAAVLGATAPALVTVGTFRGLKFNADAEYVMLTMHIPPDWDGASDMTLLIFWMPTAGDPVANGETVKWDISYRCIAVGDTVDNDTVATATKTFTGGVSEKNKQMYQTDITIDYDHGNQPLVVDSRMSIIFDRDVGGDDYSGDAAVIKWEIEYTADNHSAH